MTHECPSQERLKQHLDGALPEPEQAALTEHLDSCGDCRQTLETLAGASDSLLIAARQAGGATDAEALEGVLKQFQLHSALTQAESPVQRDESLAFLSPSDKPGHLGRLAHYEVQAVIGKGGFGIVLKAFDEKLHRIVAIKVLAPAYAAVGSARKRFIREAQTAAAIKNEHVVAIHAVEDEAQPPYLVMEIVDGISLQDKLDKNGSLPLKEILRIGLQTAEGLAAAHKHGFMHRDIKPANILLENGVERVKITDFGLARAVDDASVTQSGTVAGTPMYMSPEQAEGLAVDHRSDLFSLGTVLYVMCTGHPPFRASGTHAVLKRVIEATPRPIREINNEIPAWLCDIIAKLHAKKPEERYQTAKEVAELLGARLADVQAGRAIGQTQRASRVSGGSETQPPPAYAGGSPRRRWIAGLAAFAAIVALAWWLHPYLLLNLTNSARIWISGQNAVALQWELTRDGELVKEFKGLGFQGFDVEPGDYVLRPTNLKPGAIIHFNLRRQGLFAGGAAWKESDHLTFNVERGESITIDAEAIPAKAIEPKPKTPEETGWVHLFNGKDLTGWNSFGTGKWKVDGDILVGTGADARVAYAQPFQDFHLHARVKFNEAAYGTISFRSEDAKMLTAHGEVIIGNETHARLGKTGSAHLYYNPKLENESRFDQELVPVDTWFDLDIIVRGKEIVAKVNGATTAQIRPERIPSRGSICLNLYQKGSVIEFSNIKIKELPPEEPGWVKLFNGKDLDGWTVDPGFKGSWNVDDGVIVGKSGVLKSAKMFQDFHCLLEVKMNTGGEGEFGFRATKDNLVFASIGSKFDVGGIGSLKHFRRGGEKVLVESKKKLPDDDRWVILEVSVQGKKATVKINGETTAEKEIDAMEERGFLDLALERPGSILQLRKIVIKELPPPFAVAPFDAAKAKEHQDAWAKHLGVEPEITNSIDMKLRLIPPGKNTVGAAGAGESADAFFLGTTEVTVAQFRRFVKDAKYQTAGEVNKLGGNRVHAGKKTERDPKATWSNPDYARGDDHPITLVTWHDAMAFCEWLSRNEGRTYRLPTQAEWKWAERAGSESRYYFGDASATMDAHGWLVANSAMHTHGVGQKQRNPWGLFDIYGNAWELSYDWQREGKPAAPGLLKLGPGASDRICFLGGGYSSAPEEVLQPAYGPSNVGYSHLGFRVALVGDLKASARPPASKPLFNGKDLDGWLIPPAEVTKEDDRPWKVEADSLTSAGGFLRTAKAYQDYELTLEFRCPNPWASQEHSVVLFHVQEPGDSKSAGCLISLSEPMRSLLYRGAAKGNWIGQAGANWDHRSKGAWNTLRVRAQEAVIELWINDVYLGRMTDCTITRGFIALHARKSELQFRNIRIRELAK